MINQKKKFVDKKSSVTFQVVHRSLKDPLSVDETAPQRVLVPVCDKQPTKHKSSDKCDLEKKEHEKKYGIVFDNSYKYLKLLKDVNRLPTEWGKEESSYKKNSEIIGPNPKVILPSSIFESHIEEKVALYDKVTPGLKIQLESYDPDVIAALDNDKCGDYEELEDNFVQLAEKEFPFDITLSSSDNSGAVSNGGAYFGSSNKNNLIYNTFDEELKSRFTAHSMSSSIIKRNEKLNLLDDKFENMYADYDEEQIGALNCDNIEGHLYDDSEVVVGCREEYERFKNPDVENIASLLNYQVKITNTESPTSYKYYGDAAFEKISPENHDDKWDCESILSIYSNTYNHPKLIVETLSKDSSIKINSKTGLPTVNLNRPVNEKLTSENLIRFEVEYSKLKEDDVCVATNSIKSLMSTLSYRPENETLDEKKKRKKTIKNYRKGRRKERKENTIAFKEEKKRQEKILINEQQNVQGNRIF